MLQLPEFVTESQRLAELQGNVGRKLSRQVDRLFPRGVFEYDVHCVWVDDLADHALFARRMQQACARASDDAAGVYEVSAQPRHIRGDVRLAVTLLEFPEDVRQKRNLLARFARVMSLLIMTAYFPDRDTLGKARRAQLEEEAYDTGCIQFAYLAEVCAGDYTHMNEIWGNFLQLAFVLNPEAQTAYRASMEQLAQRARAPLRPSEEAAGMMAPA